MWSSNSTQPTQTSHNEHTSQFRATGIRTGTWAFTSHGHVWLLTDIISELNATKTFLWCRQGLTEPIITLNWKWILPRDWHPRCVPLRLAIQNLIPDPVSKNGKKKETLPAQCICFGYRRLVTSATCCCLAFCFLFFCLFCFRYRILLCNLGQPGTCYVNHIGF